MRWRDHDAQLALATIVFTRVRLDYAHPQRCAREARSYFNRECAVGNKGM
jgi:hypothetical protein